MASSQRGLNKTPKNFTVEGADEIIDLDVDSIPEGAILNGFEEYWVQELIIKTHVICYRRKRYQLLDGSYIIAPLPSSVDGHYGPGVKQFIINQTKVCNVSQTKVHQGLEDVGIQISAGQISNIILAEAAKLEEEYHEIAQSGIQTAKVMGVDDTFNRHKGENGSTLTVQNELFTYFKSSNSKSRKNFLLALRTNHKDYIFNQAALDYVNSYKPTSGLLAKLEQMRDKNHVCKDRSDWVEFLEKNEITNKNTSKSFLQIIEEAAIMGSAVAHGLNPKTALMSDGARQYYLLLHLLCWIHAERAIKKLVPLNDQEAEEIKKIRSQIWNFYDELKEYKINPTLEEKTRLDNRFDQIFGQSVINDKLAVVLGNFRKNKKDLLRVLDLPFVPLHNNASELAIRNFVIVRKMNGGTRSDDGLKAKDIYATIIGTARKNSISPWALLGSRIRKNKNVPYLPDVIRKRAMQSSSPPGASQNR